MELFCFALSLAMSPSKEQKREREQIVMSRKVVYNACYGGFGLSDKAKELGRKLSNNPEWGEWEYDLPRHDPILVQVVEQLGQKANSRHADLQIREVTHKYRISQYDGSEEVIQPHEDSYID